MLNYTETMAKNEVYNGVLIAVRFIDVIPNPIFIVLFGFVLQRYYDCIYIESLLLFCVPFALLGAVCSSSVCFILLSMRESLRFNYSLVLYRCRACNFCTKVRNIIASLLRAERVVSLSNKLYTVKNDLAV